MEKELKFTDKFFLSPKATLVLICSIILGIVSGGGLWYIISGISIMWIISTEMKYKSGELTINKNGEFIN